MTLAEKLGTTSHLSGLLVKARRLGMETPEALEISVLFIGRAATLAMQINTLRIALPNLHDRSANRRAVRPQDASAEIRHFAQGGSRGIVDDQQIVIRIERQMVGIKRPFSLLRRAEKLFCKRAGRCEKGEAQGCTAEKFAALHPV